MEINWNKYFDHIFILSKCSNFERREKLNQELKRVGLYDYVTYLYQPDSKLIAYRNSSLPEKVYRATYAHYSCIKMCYELKYNHILILEDDILFIKDINILYQELKDFYNKRDNLDIYLFEYICKDDNIYPISNPYSLLDDGCTYMNRHGMEYLIYCLEHFKDLQSDMFYYTNLDIYFDIYYNYLLNNKLYEIYIPKETNLLPITIDYCPKHIVIQTQHKKYYEKLYN